MKADIWGQLKDQKAFLLSIAGLVIVVVFIGYMNRNGGYLNSMENITGTSLISRPSSTTPSSTSIGPTQKTANKLNKYSSAPAMTIDTNKDYKAEIVTNYGTIFVDLFEEETPLTVNNFVFLSNEDFYDDLTFHRIVKSFVIQGGDPAGNGSGGPGYVFANEVNTKHQYEQYVLGMANSGLNTNGSQFFITTKTFQKGGLSVSEYTLFGKVTSGFDVVDKIEAVPTKGETPTQQVIIQDVIILK